jgi:pimeloyl-ACP methyl ester carboxylesterase
MSQQELSPTTLAGFPAIRIEGAKGRPPLLFVHGAFAGNEPFAGWMKVLARQGWPGIAAARRGRQGVGPESAAGLTIADYVDDTLRVIDALGEAPVIVGHSLGGLIAQKIAELGRCRAAVLLAPAPAGMLTAQPVALPALLPMFPKILLGQPVRPSCRTCETIVLNRMPVEDRGRIHDSLVHESGKVYREMIFGTFRVDAAKVGCPVLVMNGREDRVVSVALARQTAQRYGAELKLYEGHGHWLLEEPGFEALALDAGAWLDAAVPRLAAPRSATPMRRAG